MERSRCQFWLPKKNRFCSNAPFHDSFFCGNHSTRSDDQWIPCPVDPSQSVLQDNLEGHVKRCPLLKQVQSLTLQPFYQKGINAGSGRDEDKKDLDNVSSEMKRASVYGMSVPEFCKLIQKIESVHGAICKDISDSYKMPEPCNMWIKGEVDRKLPFQEKHVLQQASIHGNLEEFGVLKNDVVREQYDSQGACEDDKNGVPAVIEFGAGRGYLTQMLADCYGIKRVFLVERKSYKLKADRYLRQKESLVLERLRIDSKGLWNPFIDENFDSIVQCVQCQKFKGEMSQNQNLGCNVSNSQSSDLTLRCCLAEHSRRDNLRGLAVATCCHHLSQWKHYINKKYLSKLGIAKEEFHAITWFTSWAVDADHGSDLPEVANVKWHPYSTESEKCCGDANGVEDVVRDMKPVERAALGFMCKQIIDMGRLMWVKECGLESQLVRYVPSSISPENHLLIARHGNHF